MLDDEKSFETLAVTKQQSVSSSKHLSLSNSIENKPDHKRTHTHHLVIQQVKKPHIAYRRRAHNNITEYQVEQSGSQQTEITHESLSPHSLALKLSQYELEE